MSDYNLKSIHDKLIEIGVKKDDTIYCHSNIGFFGKPAIASDVYICNYDSVLIFVDTAPAHPSTPRLLPKSTEALERHVRSIKGKQSSLGSLRAPLGPPGPSLSDPWAIRSLPQSYNCVFESSWITGTTPKPSEPHNYAKF